MLADIDHFKTFNDTVRPPDRRSGAVASSRSALKDNVKGQDVAASFGGEEFAVILPGTSLRQATTTVGEQHPPRGDGQGTDEAFDRRKSGPHHHFSRRRIPAPWRNGRHADRACRQLPLRRQAQRP